jgi:hypothetical protein
MQPLTLTTPIPAGRTVHISVVTTAATVMLSDVSDVGGNPYSLVATGSVGAFQASLLVGSIETALPAGDSISIALTASGGGGSSCANSFQASGVRAFDQSAFQTGSTSPASVTTPALATTGELAQVLLFGPPGPMTPIVTRDPPLVDVTNGACVGTSSGSLCTFDSYALLASADPFTASLSFTNGLSWGLLVATYAPEPDGGALGATALVVLAALAAHRSRARPQVRSAL